MQGKIALEEHFAIEYTHNDSKGFFPDKVWQEVRARVLDLHDRRLSLMDEYGIEMMLLSLNAPAVQAIPDPAHATAVARKANHYLAAQVRTRPDRFQRLAALALQAPDGATRVLARGVTHTLFSGTMPTTMVQAELQMPSMMTRSLRSRIRWYLALYSST